jgi:hypothetical protein
MVAPDGLPIHANIDAVVIENGNPVEAKTGGLFGPLWGEWGEPGSGDVPEPYIVQCHLEMLCAEKELCHVPAFLGGRGFQLYHVPLNKDLMEIIKERALDFWNNHVLKDIPPPESDPSLSIMGRVRRTPGKRVRVSSESIIAWRTAASSGNSSKAASSGDSSKAEQKGESGIAASIGNSGNSKAGELGLLILCYWDEPNKRYRAVVGNVGEAGIKADTWYRLNDKHEMEEVQ